MNAVFHLVAALAVMGLVLLLLRAQRQREYLRSLLNSQRQADAARRVVVASPIVFLREFAHTLGITWDGPTFGELPPAKMDVGPWTELFLRDGISSLHVRRNPASGAAVRLEVVPRRPVVDGATSGRLAGALGGRIEVILLPATGVVPSSPES